MTRWCSHSERVASEHVFRNELPNALREPIFAGNSPDLRRLAVLLFPAQEAHGRQGA